MTDRILLSLGCLAKNVRLPVEPCTIIMYTWIDRIIFKSISQFKLFSCPNEEEYDKQSILRKPIAERFIHPPVCHSFIHPEEQNCKDNFDSLSVRGDLLFQNPFLMVNFDSWIHERKLLSSIYVLPNLNSKSSHSVWVCSFALCPGLSSETPSQTDVIMFLLSIIAVEQMSPRRWFITIYASLLLRLLLLLLHHPLRLLLLLFEMLH